MWRKAGKNINSNMNLLKQKMMPTQSFEKDFNKNLLNTNQMIDEELQT